MRLAKTTGMFVEGSGIMPSPYYYGGWKETSRWPIQANHNRPRSFGSISGETYNREPLAEAFLINTHSGTFLDFLTGAQQRKE